MVTLAAILIGLFLVAIGFGANFYLFSQWLVYPKMRHRLRGGRPYVAVGGCLYLLGGSMLGSLGRAQYSGALTALGTVIGLVGVGLTLYAAVRLRRANAAERRARRDVGAAPTLGGMWPLPPDVPTN